MMTQTSVSNARRTFGVLTVLSGVGLAVFTAMNRPFIGVGAFILAFAGSMLVQARAKRPIFDERDETIASDAAGWTLAVFGWASFGIFPTLTVAWGLGIFEWEPWSSAIAMFVAALYLTYGLFVLLLLRRR